MTQVGPQPPEDVGCHRTFGGLRVRSCFEMVTKHKCQLWVHIVGEDKNTGQPVNCYGCADALERLLQVEVAQTNRFVSGEVSQMRKEARDHQRQADANAMALNNNLILMHSQSTQVALGQIASRVSLNDAPHLLEADNG